VVITKRSRDIASSKVHVLRFREVNRDIFNAIKSGKKRVETRAATIRFHTIQPGDTIRMVCGKDAFEKRVKSAETFKTISALFEKHDIKDLNPFADSREDMEKMYFSFPGYREKIRRYGLIAFEFK